MKLFKKRDTNASLPAVTPAMLTQVTPQAPQMPQMPQVPQMPPPEAPQVSQATMVPPPPVQRPQPSPIIVAQRIPSPIAQMPSLDTILPPGVIDEVSAEDLSPAALTRKLETTEEEYSYIARDRDRVRNKLEELGDWLRELSDAGVPVTTDSFEFLSQILEIDATLRESHASDAIAESRDVTPKRRHSGAFDLRELRGA